MIDFLLRIISCTIISEIETIKITTTKFNIVDTDIFYCMEFTNDSNYFVAFQISDVQEFLLHGAFSLIYINTRYTKITQKHFEAEIQRERGEKKNKNRKEKNTIMKKKIIMEIKTLIHKPIDSNNTTIHIQIGIDFKYMSATAIPDPSLMPQILVGLCQRLGQDF